VALPPGSAIIWALLALFLPATAHAQTGATATTHAQTGATATAHMGPPATTDAPAPTYPDLRTQLQGTVVDPVTGEGIPDARVFFEASPDSARTDGEGRFALAAVAERALRIEHPDYLDLRFPAEFPERLDFQFAPAYLAGEAEILAVPHLHRPERPPASWPLFFVVGPGRQIIATVSPEEGTWCGADDPNSPEAQERIGGIRVIKNGRRAGALPTAIDTETLFGGTAWHAVMVLTCKGAS